MSVDLLLITWNRPKYLKRTLSRLKDMPDRFRLSIWDNASDSATREIVEAFDDHRVTRRHFNKQNVKQLEPTFWFLSEATGSVVGKIDDDVLLPDGWIERIEPMISSQPRFGMLGCNLFLPDEWDETVTKNHMQVGSWEVHRTIGIAGQAFLCRHEYMTRYASQAVTHGLPVDRLKMTIDGLISGYPLPMIYAENMDHPRSSLNIYTRDDNFTSPQSSLSAKFIGFKNVEENAQWLRSDAHRMCHELFEDQLRKALVKRHEKHRNGFKSVVRQYSSGVLRVLGKEI